jgi:hypothetical protein
VDALIFFLASAATGRLASPWWLWLDSEEPLAVLRLYQTFTNPERLISGMARNPPGPATCIFRNADIVP